MASNSQLKWKLTISEELITNGKTSKEINRMSRMGHFTFFRSLQISVDVF